MASLVADAQRYADWIANALTTSGYSADFTLESLKEIDRFFDEHSRNGEAVPGGLLSEQLGPRIFALGAYVGEVISRMHGGTWRADESDPEGEMNMEIILSSGTIIWPMQRVMKRFKNGAEDGIYAYGCVVNH